MCYEHAFITIDVVSRQLPYVEVNNTYKDYKGE